MTAPTAPRLARQGSWTPWARILCVECDYTELKDSPRAPHHATHLAMLAGMDRMAEIPCPDSDAWAICDGCGASCWVRSDVALLQRVGLMVFSSLPPSLGLEVWGRMHQTGGMCAALLFTSGTGQVVVTATDGFFGVGKYLADDAGWENPLGPEWHSAPLYTEDEDGVNEERTTPIVCECARQVVAFVRPPVDHEAAAGVACHEGPDGFCTSCGVEMTTCNVCKGIGYHRPECSLCP